MEKFNYQNSAIPNYSGITINITTPTVNAGPQQACECQQHKPYDNYATSPIQNEVQNTPAQYQGCNQYGIYNYPQGQGSYPAEYYLNNQYSIPQQAMPQQNNQYAIPQEAQVAPQGNNYYIPEQEQQAQVMPQQGNQYAVPQGTQTVPQQGGQYVVPQQGQEIPQQNNQYINPVYVNYPEQRQEVPYEQNIPAYINPEKSQAEETKTKENNLETSTDIINKLDVQAKEEIGSGEKKSKKEVVALTDDYIMSLENYLDNPDKEIRLMAAKEVLTRLDEDHSRADDLALNALLNKMMQDPSRIIKNAAFSAFSSGLANGNDFTVELLNNIQNNPHSDKSDVIESAQILLNMTHKKETILIDEDPNKYGKEINRLRKEISAMQSSMKTKKAEEK